MMSNSDIHQNVLIGQRVRVEENKYGFVRFYGETSFAEGLWCGIELDEGFGENDGMVNDIRYFSCKNNYGIFIPASEIRVIKEYGPVHNFKDSLVLSCTEPLPSKTIQPCNTDLDKKSSNKFCLSSDCQLNSSEVLFKNNALNESYTISKGANLSCIVEENSGFSCLNATHLKSFQSIINLTEKENISIAMSSHQSFFDYENCKIKDHDLNEDWDSDESLGILPGALEDFTWDDFNLEKTDPDENLNVTVNLNKELSDEFIKSENCGNKLDTEESISPISHRPNISLVTTDDSPVYTNQKKPVCASTPKHSTNFSYTINEETDSPQNKFSNSYLEKITTHNFSEKENIEVILEEINIVETNLSPKIDRSSNFPEDVPELDVLNITCNINKQLPSREVSLNKTFESPNVLNETCVLLPLLPESEQCNLIDFNLDQKIDLNQTCNIVKEGEFKENTNNILNMTSSYPQELNKTQNIIFIDENNSNNIESGRNDGGIPGDILNTTYEKVEESFKSDSSCQTLKCITNLKHEKKSLVFDKKDKSKKTESRKLFSKDLIFKKDEIKTKNSVFDRNRKMRRSVGCFNKNILAEEQNKPARRNSIASNAYSSEIPKSQIISHCADKCLPLIESESKFDDRDESQLNKTINLSPPVVDVGKTVVKKPRNSINFPFHRKNFEPIPVTKSRISISSLQRNTTVLIPAKAKEKAPEAVEDENFLLIKNGLKNCATLVEKVDISRKIPCKEKEIPEKCNKYEQFTSSGKSGLRQLAVTEEKNISLTFPLQGEKVKKLKKNEDLMISSVQRNTTILIPTKEKSTPKPHEDENFHSINNNSLKNSSILEEKIEISMKVPFKGKEMPKNYNKYEQFDSSCKTGLKQLAAVEEKSIPKTIPLQEEKVQKLKKDEGFILSFETDSEKCLAEEKKRTLHRCFSYKDEKICRKPLKDQNSVSLKESDLNKTIEIEEGKETLIQLPSHKEEITRKNKKNENFPSSKINSEKPAIMEKKKVFSFKISSKEVIHKFEEVSSTLPVKTCIKKPASGEENMKLSKLPQRVAAPKTAYSSIPLPPTKTSSIIARPPVARSGLRPPSARNNSQYTALKTARRQEKEPTIASLNETMLISAPQNLQEKNITAKSSQNVLRRTESCLRKPSSYNLKRSYSLQKKT